MANTPYRGRSQLGLTPAARGWVKRLDGKTRWIVAYGVAPTADLADKHFARVYGRMIAPTTVDAVTVEYGVAQLMQSKRAEVSSYTMEDYKSILDAFEAFVGSKRRLDSIGPLEFTAYAQAIAHYSVSRRSKIVGVIRTAFNWFIEQDWIPSVRYGPVFKQPTKRAQRIDYAQRPRRLYSAGDVRALLAHADPVMRAAIYCGINAAFGNADVARIQRAQLDGDILRCDRVKTGALRVAPLWKPTLRAINRLGAGALLIHRNGKPVCSDTCRGDFRGFKDICERAGVPNLGFYSLRRTWRTVADEVPDARAVSIVMGHDIGDTGGIYVQRVDLARLRIVTAHVRRWLISGRRAKP